MHHSRRLSGASGRFRRPPPKVLLFSILALSPSLLLFFLISRRGGDIQTSPADLKDNINFSSPEYSNWRKQLVAENLKSLHTKEIVVSTTPSREEYSLPSLDGLSGNHASSLKSDPTDEGNQKEIVLPYLNHNLTSTGVSVNQEEDVHLSDLQTANEELDVLQLPDSSVDSARRIVVSTTPSRDEYGELILDGLKGNHASSLKSDPTDEGNQQEIVFPYINHNLNSTEVSVKSEEGVHLADLQTPNEELDVFQLPDSSVDSARRIVVSTTPSRDEYSEPNLDGLRGNHASSLKSDPTDEGNRQEIVLPYINHNLTSTGLSAKREEDVHLADLQTANEELDVLRLPDSSVDSARRLKGVRRATDAVQKDDDALIRLENAAIESSKAVDSAVLGKYNIWRRENENENSDSIVRAIREQIVMAKVFTVFAKEKKKLDLYQELLTRIKESQRALGEANSDSELHKSAPEKVKAMAQVLSKARQLLYDCKSVTHRLRAMLQSADEQVRGLKKQSTFLSQLAAKTIPNGIHCLSMRLTIDYYLLPIEKRKFPRSENLENPNLYHYALFSDNVLAASVVVNSTIINAKEPEKHVFHLVTDKLNFGAMNMWFLLYPPGKATIHVHNVDDFKWLNSSYCPVLRQLESASMKEYYFKADHPTTAGSSNLKYRNPKYLSMLNHLRFYLPEVYPKLEKILFLDDDIVVQKDLTALWTVDLNGNVNGAVETCGESFHRFDKYLNFSNPHIANNFDPNACGWAYGMNIFDLNEWKKKDITGIYHKWQTMNEDRVLWKLGTLPPGLMTFYKLTHPLDKSWHVLGLGYSPSIERTEIENAAVVHYNGNMKPWLELAMRKYRPYWTKYMKYDHPYISKCSLNE